MGIGNSSKRDREDRQKVERSIYQFDETCGSCGFNWGKILVEFQPGEKTKTIELTCPDCGLQRKRICTKKDTSKYPIK